MIAANLAQKSRSETCALTPAMVADDWLFSSSSSVLCPKPATVSATVGSGIVASTGVERWSKSRDSAVVSATARPGQSHRSRQIGVLPRGQQKDGGRSGLVGLSIAKPSVYENRGLAYQTYSRLNIHASRATASSVPPSELSPNRAPNWSWAMTFITGKSCHPKGFLDNQYGIFRRLNNNALVNIAQHQNFKMVWTKCAERSSSHQSQLFPPKSCITAGKKTTKNSELNPAMADSHNQIPKVLSMVDSLRGDLREAWQSTPFNAVRAANEACHGNSLARESTTFSRGEGI